MRTNIDLDEDLLREVQRILGTRSKRETVHEALRDVLARRERLRVLELRGQVRWEGNLDESRAGDA